MEKHTFLPEVEIFQQMVHVLQDPAFLIECGTYRIVKTNEAALEIYGYIHHTDLTRRTFFELFADPSFRKESCQGARVLMERVGFIRKNGEIFYGDIHGFLLPGHIGDNPLYLVLIKNITASLQTTYQSAVWQSLFHNIPLVLWIKDTHGRYSEVNENFLRLHGLRREEVIGKTDFDLFPEAYALASSQEDHSVVYSRATIHKEESFQKNDQELWFETHKLPIISVQDQILGIAGFSLNINERKEVERQLKSKQEWLETTLRSIGEAVITLDDEGCISSLNPIAETYLGISQVRAIGRPLQDIVFIRNPEENQIEDPFALLKSKGIISLLQKDRLLVNSQGMEIPIEYKLSPILDRDGYYRNDGFVLIITNVSHYKTREQNLIAENQLMREFLESSPNPIFITDKEGRIVHANEEFEQLLGLEERHISHKVFWSFFASDEEALLQKELEGLSHGMKLKNHIFTLFDKEGKRHSVEFSASRVKTSRETNYIFILNDITERMNHMYLLYKQQTSLQLIEEILLLLRKNHEALPEVCQKISKFLDVQRLFVYQWHPHKGVCEPVYLWHEAKDAPESPVLEVGRFSQDWIGELLHQRYLVLTRETPLNAYEKKLFEKTGLGSLLFLPLMNDQELWGLLGVHDLNNPDRVWDETQLLLFKAIVPLFLQYTAFRSK
ncbi:PAS domain S-box protein [Thermospira aquatica]|uniref:PAS domain S-box protein n=1 Tax=Thermospira aquatica TaxID=2828656 RepID=A0AAX3BDT4_9SPIR|nr:PAS domain S-box protein [Thermospira aquatica]URA10395.1 PAS domain S-box protein [Thermospira aquatica]